jgi:hypothetical protein
MTVTLKEIIQDMDLKIITSPGEGFDQCSPTSGYASDLLSCVMAGAKNGGIWVTLQSHINVVAVAALLEQCAVIIAENAVPEPDVMAKAVDQGVTLLSTPLPIYEVVGRLYKMGIPAG